ncbi:MAG: hypothetical protein ACRDS1_06605 [Pseudonocardiaceae bacterium]
MIEGDHGSAFFHPDSAYARAAIDCQIQLQAAEGGNALIGRQLQPLLANAGYRDVTVNPRTVYADQTRPRTGRRLHPQHVHRHGSIATWCRWRCG